MIKRVLCAALVLAACPVLATAQVIIAPNSNNANSDNRFPFLVTGGMRYQQEYDASQFSGLSGPELITQIALRPSPNVSEVLNVTLPAVQIDFSTTTANSSTLNATFANNVGANDTIVLNGPLTLTSSNTQGVFDTIISLTTPFLYDPSAGNLLMDVRNTGGAPSQVGSEFWAATSGDATSRIFGPEGTPGATSGTFDNSGLITQFTFRAQQATGTPEPGALALLAGAGTAVMALRRRVGRRP